MKMTHHRRAMRFVLTTLSLALPAAFLPSDGLRAASYDPAAGDYSGHRGGTFYVSKLGDNSDGTSWAKAFHTIQAALLAVPDDQGGHRIVVRPDTYVEANLYTSHKGAKGSYNLLIGDANGRLGSGAVGRVVVDSGDPQRGFKSYDWWSTIRAASQGWSPQHTAPTFSSICWDRWILRNLYATGGDAGLFWDLTNRSGQQFTVVVEDCVGVGRAFGGGFGYQVTRAGEPVVFRRCFLMSLDWWGDAGGLAVGSYNTSPPALPDVVCDDCTLVGPDNAVQILFPSKYIRLKMKHCRLLTLNFSQPCGTPSTGIIASIVPDAKQVHIDFEDCSMMGYKVFGASDARGCGQATYTIQGKVEAYVQFQQPIPKGFQRLGLWPVGLFRSLDPRPPTTDGAGCGTNCALSRSTASTKQRGHCGDSPLLRSSGTEHRTHVPGDPTSPDYAGRKGTTLYVSKQGDNSDGRSWAKAFHTIQAALSAVPDGNGGHRIVVRPDTYAEANLDPSYSGAAASYNLLIGDADGSLGSGGKGWVVIDSGCPGVAVRTDRSKPTGNPTWKIIKSHLPESGLKCVDWWGAVRAAPDYSTDRWDRWVCKNLYFTGSEGAGWVLTNQKGQTFSAVVDHCVSIGRFAGMCAIGHTPRRDEPVLFRHSYFMNLDWWGDAGGVYVRGENATMPDWPHAVFEDCTIVGLDNALQAGWPGVDELCTRVRFQECRLIVLNFSQPQGTPSTGIICCGCKDGKQLHIDFDNTTLMGYKVFGTRAGEVAYTIKGRVRAYVQFQQSVPKGFERVNLWPVEVFDAIQPPESPE